MGQLLDQWARREKALLVLLALTVSSVLAAEAARQGHFHGRRPPPSGGASPFAQAGARGAESEASAPQPSRGPFEAWRERFLARCAPADPDGLVRGIFLGDESSIRPVTRALFRRAGLSHLLAASGFNCWIVATLFALVAGLALRSAAPWLPGVAELWLRRSSAPLLKVAGAWLFWLWSDGSPPITRSVALISTQFILQLLELRAPFGRVLFVQYLVSLLIAPRLWQSVSFQLTFGCLFGMLLFPPMLARWKPKRDTWRADAFDYFATGLGACLGTIPTTLLSFGEANFTSLLTNWFSVPLVSAALMPVALAQMMLLTPVWPLTWISDQTSAFGLLSSASGLIASLLHEALKLYMSVVPALIWHP